MTKLIFYGLHQLLKSLTLFFGSIKLCPKRMNSFLRVRVLQIQDFELIGVLLTQFLNHLHRFP